MKNKHASILARNDTSSSAKHKAAIHFGRLGGLAKSKAKAKASRENGKKGGKPKSK